MTQSTSDSEQWQEANSESCTLSRCQRLIANNLLAITCRLLTRRTTLTELLNGSKSDSNTNSIAAHVVCNWLLNHRQQRKSRAWITCWFDVIITVQWMRLVFPSTGDISARLIWVVIRRSSGGDRFDSEHHPRIQSHRVLQLKCHIQEPSQVTSLRRQPICLRVYTAHKSLMWIK